VLGWSAWIGSVCEHQAQQRDPPRWGQRASTDRQGLCFRCPAALRANQQHPASPQWPHLVDLKQVTARNGTNIRRAVFHHPGAVPIGNSSGFGSSRSCSKLGPAQWGETGWLVADRASGRIPPFRPRPH